MIKIRNILILPALLILGCKPENDLSSLELDTIEPPGITCIGGGTKIISGIDLNGNEILDSDEVQNTVFVCNGISLEGTDYIIFGRYAGFCWGETCVETYKLTNITLYEDTIDYYPYFNATYEFIELTPDKFEVAKDLVNFFPHQLINLKDSTFGCPDCADQGGFVLQYETNADLQTWFIDRRKSHEVPDYLHGFMDKIDEKIDLINN